MKSTLLSSFLKVFAFWWTVLFMITPGKTLSEYQTSFFEYLLNGWMIAMVAAFCGAAVAMSYFWSEREDRKDKLKKSSFRGMNLTLGQLPPVRVPKMVPGWKIPEDLDEWYSNYKKAFPKHAELFDSTLSMMRATPCPASPVKGGHGDLNLMNHSFNVLREILRLAPSWEYTGSFNKKGQPVQPLDNPDYKFDFGDPLIPLLGLMHDIGKMVCYIPQKDGTTKEVLKNHDLQGGKLLVRIPAFWELLPEDRDVLILGISHYHHIIMMPLWATDRTRALTELLIVADNEAGKKEGGVFYQSESAYFITSEDADDEIEPGIKSKKHGDPKKDKKEDLISEEGEPGGGKIGSRMLEALNELICEPGRINGKDKNIRIGFKSSGYVYIQESKMREEIAKLTQDDSLLSQLHTGKVNPKTLALMERLYSMDKLYCTHDGYKYGPLTSFFNVEGSAANGNLLTNWKYAIIIKADTFPSLSSIPDCPRPLKVVKPTMGVNKAQNKAAGPIHEDALVNQDLPQTEESFESIEDKIANMALSDMSDEVESPDIDLDVGDDLVGLTEKQYSKVAMLDSLLDEEPIPDVVENVPSESIENEEQSTEPELIHIPDVNEIPQDEVDEPVNNIEFDDISNLNSEELPVENSIDVQNDDEEDDDVLLSESIKEELHKNKRGLDLAPKEREYDSVKYYMYSISLLQEYIKINWDKFTHDVEKNKVKDVIYRSNVKGEGFLGFKVKKNK